MQSVLYINVIRIVNTHHYPKIRLYVSRVYFKSTYKLGTHYKKKLKFVVAVFYAVDGILFSTKKHFEFFFQRATFYIKTWILCTIRKTLMERIVQEVVSPAVCDTNNNKTKKKNKSHSQQSERKYKNDLIPNVINIKSFHL